MVVCDVAEMKMCRWHLLESVNGKRQLVLIVEVLHSSALGQCRLFTLCFSIFFFFFKRMFICFFMKMIYINNKHWRKSAAAVCCRITWKNNDERHRALMRHLESHIKRQPGVFPHTLGNRCLSLMPCGSLKGWSATWCFKYFQKSHQVTTDQTRGSSLYI